MGGKNNTKCCVILRERERPRGSTGKKFVNGFSRSLMLAQNDKGDITKKKEKEMKRVIMMIIMLIIVIPVHATTMCAANDTVAVVLDPSLGITNYTSNATMGTWWAWNAQGTVYGISACLNSTQGKPRGGTVARLTDTNNGETKLVVGSEKNGSYCWCRLTHPVSSLWAFNYNYGSAANCASRCTPGCGVDFQNIDSLRVGLVGSVAQ